jgi:hypothetical protein
MVILLPENAYIGIGKVVTMLNLDMQLSLEVAGKDFKGNLRDIVQIKEADLNEEFIKQPSLYAWFATLCEFASAEVETQKMTLSILRANLDAEKRTELAESGKKPTENMVNSAIIIDPKHQGAETALIEAKRQYGILKGIVKALEQRKDMLIQVGSTKRQELSLNDFGINLDKVRKQQ